MGLQPVLGRDRLPDRLAHGRQVEPAGLGRHPAVGRGAGAEPLLSWRSLWQWLVMAVGGAASTPVLFYLFDRFIRAFSYRPPPETSFRPDREIKRDRGPHVDY